MLNGDHLLFSSTVFSKYEQIRENLTTMNPYIVQPLEVLREKCPNTEFFLVCISRIRTEYGEIRGICPYSVRTWENTDQNKLRVWALFKQYTVFLRSQSHGDPNITKLVYFSFYFIISFYPGKKFKRPTNINQK